MTVPAWSSVIVPLKVGPSAGSPQVESVWVAGLTVAVADSPCGVDAPTVGCVAVGEVGDVGEVDRVGELGRGCELGHVGDVGEVGGVDDGGGVQVSV